MFKFFYIFCLYSFCLYGQVDFDCVVVGSSPTSLFEAIYQTSIGKKVVVVEQSSECGGAWKSIDICGIQHADMGCHEFGNTEAVRTFLQDYAGCTIVDNTLQKRLDFSASTGFYPSRGCYELIHNLQLLMEKLGTLLLLNTKLESVFIDHARNRAEVIINGMHLTTSKIIITNGAEIHFENEEYRLPAAPLKHKYYHLYLLIGDPTPARFTYNSVGIDGATRAMNMTCYVGLEETGMQLIAIQTHQEKCIAAAETFLNELKKKGLVGPDATIIRTDSYVYEQAACSSNRAGIQNSPFFEHLSTGHIGQIKNHLPKWKQGMRTWNEVMTRP